MTTEARRAALSRVYPEVGAGGHTRVDGTVEFYGRVNALLPEGAHVLDFGAGRGQWREDPSEYRRRLQSMRSRAAHVVGVDVDPAVRENENLDEAHVLDLRGSLPLADASVDLVVSDWVLEHVTEPARWVAEVDRVLRPGGWFCARTPNKWGYQAVATRAVPNRRHSSVLRVFQPHRQERDVFPVAYQLNTRRALREAFGPYGYTDHSYVYSAEPAYFGTSVVALRGMLALQRALPSSLGTVLMAFLQKDR